MTLQQVLQMTIYSVIKNKNKNIQVRDIADKIGISREAMSRKLAKDYFTKDEILKIIDIMQFDSDDILRMFI